MLSVQARLGLLTEPIDGAVRQAFLGLRCALPGIVTAFDPDTQTCTVQPAVQDIIARPPNGQNAAGGGPDVLVPTNTTILPLQDVPVVFPRAGGWAMTFPVEPGDECLLVFGDMCIDGWWQNGGVQPQYDWRRHDLSDAFALFGPWSQPRRLSNYSTNSMQIRSEDGSVAVSLAPGSATVSAPQVQVDGANSVQITSPSVAAANGGTTLPLVTQDLYTWVNSQLLPTLAAKGITVPAPPTTSVTTVLQAE